MLLRAHTCRGIKHFSHDLACGPAPLQGLGSAAPASALPPVSRKGGDSLKGRTGTKVPSRLWQDRSLSPAHALLVQHQRFRMTHRVLKVMHRPAALLSAQVRIHMYTARAAPHINTNRSNIPAHRQFSSRKRAKGVKALHLGLRHSERPVSSS